MAITLEANLKDIRVTGGTSGAPVTWEDIVAADASGGWGRITTVNATVPKQYTVATDTRIFVGNGGTTSTYVAVERCQITFTNGHFQVASGADVTKGTLRFGQVNSEIGAVNITMRGLTTDSFVRVAGTGTWLIYQSVVSFADNLIANALSITIDDSMLLGLNFRGFWGGNITATDSIINRWQTYGNTVPPSFTRTAVWIIESTAAITLRDIRSGIQQFVTNKSPAGYSFSLYDVDYTGAVVFSSGSGTPATLAEYSTLGVTVQDAAGDAISGATVVVKNVGGATIYSGATDANGQIAAMDVLWRERLVTAFNTFTDTAHTPHTVTIEKAGCLARVLVLDMSSKHVEVEVLEPLPDWPAVGDVESGVAFDGGAKVGTLVVPDESAVRAGVGYGASGAEFAGEFSPTVVVGEGLAAALTNDILSIAIIEDALVATVED
jgi:hypothetical protein